MRQGHAEDDAVDEPEPPVSDVEPEAQISRTPAAQISPRGARRLGALLSRGETVKRVTRATYEKRRGVLVLTSQRVMFLRDTWSRLYMDEFHLASVSAITLEQSVDGSTIGMHTPTGVSVITCTHAGEARALVGEAQRLLSYVRSPVASPRPRMIPPPTPTTATPAAVAQPTAGSALMANLRELAQLRQDGLLDDYEFAVAKSKLLS